MFFNEKLTLRHSRVGENPALKAGVSLVTVLLFMLVATIAATATYKWLTSENRSSASRLMKQEAMESSLAGLENARSWMTYHANDVGSLIHQFIKGDNKPININGRLRTLQRSGQNYNVWLTGVNTSKSTYKLKFVSYGESRGGARHAEAAIFNVDGLYQVTRPSDAVKPIDFDKAFAGAMGKLTNSPTIESAIVNGDYEGNQPSVRKSMLVTGNVKLEGPKSGYAGLAGADLYVKGDVHFNGNNSIGGNSNVVYVGGKMDCDAGEGSIYIGGDVYVGGDINTEQKNCGLYVDGSLTSGGRYIYWGQKDAKDKDGNDCQKTLTKYNGSTQSIKLGLCIRDNFVFTEKEESKYDIKNDGKGNFWVGGNWYAPKKIEGHCAAGGNCGDANGNRLSLIDGKVYRYTGATYYSILKQQYKEYNFYTGWSDWIPYSQNYGIYMSGTTQNEINNVGMYYNNNDTENYSAKNKRLMGFRVSNIDDVVASPTISAWKEDDDVLKNIGGNYWTNIKKMTEYGKLIKGTPPAAAEVPQPILPNNEDVWTGKPANARCIELGYTHIKNPIAYGNLANSTADDVFDELNKCYSKLQAAGDDVLYNGFMIVRFSADAGGNMNQNVGTIMDGKFVFHFTGAIAEANVFYLPATKADAAIFLYIPNGGHIRSAKPETGKTYQDYNYNYFVMSNGETQALGLKVDGSIVMGKNAEGHNAKFTIGDGNTELNFKKSVLTAIAGAGLIRQNPNYGTTGGGSGSTSSITETTPTQIPDDYYITMAPQLGVSLESRYETSETFSTVSASVTELKQAFIVLPRVIYLPKDPYGKLSDYYNVLPLNGSAIKKSDVNVVSAAASANSCTALVGEKLVTGNGTLTEGNYHCTAKASGHDDVDFWVVVSGEQRTTPSIYFVEPSQAMPATTTTPYQVHAYIPAHANSITLTVQCPSLGTDGDDYSEGNGWRYELEGGTKTSNSCTFVIPGKDTPEARLLFSVATSDAANGTLTFHLQKTGTDYDITSPYSAELHVSSTASINREEATSEEIVAFCADRSDCPSNMDDWPDMNCISSVVGTWVDVTGVSHGPIMPNESWSIDVGGTGTAKLTSLYNGNECMVIIPPNDERPVSNVKPNSTITPALRATLKPKAKSLKVGFTGNTGGYNPTIIVNAGTSIDESGIGSRIQNEQCTYNSTNDGSPKYCSYDVFPGEYVTFKVKEGTDAKNFNYWKCASDNCPNMEPLNNRNYTTMPIQISMAYTYTYLAHFGESDNHCFFEEFKQGEGSDYSRVNRATLECSEGVDYCIDDCNGSGCSSAETEAGYKWRIMGASLSLLDYNSLYGYLSVKSSLNKKKSSGSRRGVVVMSTVNAGIDGSMKALVQVPSASAHGQDSRDILGSGIILRSNKSATEYLMVNVYSNASRNLEARVCKVDGTNEDCLPSHELKDDNTNSTSVGYSGMAMVTVTADGTNLIVSAVTNPEGYYGQAVTEYTHTFDVASINYNDRAHEYVGFGIADASFKIHGIGWHSKDYNADCFDTYPTVKCSFAAVSDGGVIPTGTKVKPWVGYSGWFSSSGTCTEKFYYYNGSDACEGPSGTAKADCGDGYTFAANTTSDRDNEGPHGYQENSVDKKTAKAWLECPTKGDLEDKWWSAATENEYAHCGYFWTGKYQECANDKNDLLGLSATPKTISTGDPVSIALVDAPVNLRHSSLNISLEENDGDGQSIEIWLESDNDSWGSQEPFQSISVMVTGNSANFPDVAKSFPGDSSGFNPEQVSRIMIKNHGTSSVKVTGISATCANTIDITGCKADYDEGMGQWNIEMTVTNRSKIDTKQYKANYLNGGAYTSGNCQDGAVANKIICSDASRNPYENDQGLAYEFAVKVVGNSGRSTVEKEDCTVTPTKIGTISCSNYSASDVTSGQNWPQFNFKLNHCPGNSCSYDVYLDNIKLGNVCGNGSEACSGSGTGAITKTISGKATECTNVDGCTHTYTVKSSDNSKPFDDCPVTFKVNPKGVITANCAFSPATVAKGGTATLQMTNIQNVDANTSISVTCTNCPSGYTFTPSVTSLSSGNTAQNITFTAPNSASSGYTYSVKYTPAGGSAREICSSTPTLTVVDGLSCSNVSPSQIYLGQDFKFTPAGGGTCTSATLSKSNNSDAITNGSGSPCPASYIVTPATVGDNQKYTYTFNGPIGTLTCDAVVDVKAPPDFTCPTNTPGTVNEDVTIALTGISGCGNGCTVSVSPSVTIKNSSGTVSSSATSHSLVFEGVTSMPSPNPVQYEVTLTGGIGTKKTCPVTYTSGGSGECECVAFVNGVGGGYEDCYNSGLAEMEEGKCYAINPDRKPVTDAWINNRAVDTYWWVEVSCCSGGGSSSAAEASSSSGGNKCITFVNGVGDGYEDCYNSGLAEMEEGKCYAINPDRKPVTDAWINNRAADTYWWVEVSCN